MESCGSLLGINKKNKMMTTESIADDYLLKQEASKHLYGTERKRRRIKRVVIQKVFNIRKDE